MKLLSLFSLVFIGLLNVPSKCKKGIIPPQQQVKEAVVKALPFTHVKVRTLMDTKCKNCHAMSGFAAGLWLYDPDNYEASIQKNASLIHQETKDSNAGMSETAGLTEEEIKLLNEWFEAGSPRE